MVLTWGAEPATLFQSWSSSSSNVSIQVNIFDLPCLYARSSVTLPFRPAVLRRMLSFLAATSDQGVLPAAAECHPHREAAGVHCLLQSQLPSDHLRSSGHSPRGHVCAHALSRNVSQGQLNSLLGFRAMNARFCGSLPDGRMVVPALQNPAHKFRIADIRSGFDRAPQASEEDATTVSDARCYGFCPAKPRLGFVSRCHFCSCVFHCVPMVNSCQTSWPEVGL